MVEDILAQMGGMGVILAIWIAFANPTIVEAYRKAQWAQEDQVQVDYKEHSQRLRAAGVGMYSAVLVGTNVVYPINWLFLLLAFGLTYWLSLKLIKRIT